MSTPTSRRPRRRTATLAGLGVVATGLLAGCSQEQVSRGWMPTGSGTTSHSDDIVALWTGSWIAALGIGALVWGLLIWCVIVYRKRKDDNRLPIQLRYHLPLELLYTFVPIVMIGTLFYFTANLQEDLTAVDEEGADVRVEVYARQWSWDFNYLDDNVWDAGEPAELDGTLAASENFPTLYLPVDQNVHFTLHSRDVVHSFWVPAFVYKEDMLPGVTNEFQLTPQEEGVFLGKCAELCGEMHGYMLFNVAVVSQDEYDAHMEELRAAGQEGRLGEEYDRLDTTYAGALQGDEN